MTDQDGLIARLRQLSLVDLDALLAGAEGEHRARLLDTFAEDLEDALGQARSYLDELLRAVAGGSDPLALLDASPDVRSRESGRAAAAKSAQRMMERASASRALARLGDASAPLLSLLFEVDRRRAATGR